MADVRLTATNPDDSTVVPVACNAKGELKLEEIPDQSFDGNLDGDLTVTGSGTFAGDVAAGELVVTENKAGIELSAAGTVTIQRASGVTSPAIQVFSGTTSQPTVEIDPTSDATFKGDIHRIGNYKYDADNTSGVEIDSGSISSQRVFDSPDSDLSRAYAHRYGKDIKIEFFNNGSAEFKGTVDSNVQAGGTNCFTAGYALTNDTCVIRGNGSICGNDYGSADPNNYTYKLDGNGRAYFKSDVIVGSRNKQWMIVESNGLAHLVEQTRSTEISTADLVDPASSASTADLVDPEPLYPPLRDIPAELTMVEQQLQKVMERLKMAPEAGWEVWDGSD